MSFIKRNHRVRPYIEPKEGFFSRLLDPIDRLSETIYTVLIALVFTLTYRIVMISDDPGLTLSSDYGFELSTAILGAALAWGIIDGLMYALIEVFARSERQQLLQHIQAADTMDTAVEVIADELDFILEPITSQEQRQALYEDVHHHLREGKSQEVGLRRQDVVGAFGSVLVAILAVLPSVLPFFLLPRNAALAVRISNIVSFVVLFWAGYSWGKYTQTNPWRTGVLLVAVGLMMVLIALFLGG